MVKGKGKTKVVAAGSEEVEPAATTAPKPRRRRVQAQRSESAAVSEALGLDQNASNDARQPWMCTGNKVIRYPRNTEEYPPEMWGRPQLDDNGERMYTECYNKAIKGSDVCGQHGGTLPVVRKSAEELLAACRDKLMGGLLQIAFDENYDSRLRFDAMKWGLERAGFQAGVTVSLGNKPWQEVLRTIASGLDAAPDQEEI